jgi:hypothetical protein
MAVQAAKASSRNISTSRSDRQGLALRALAEVARGVVGVAAAVDLASNVAEPGALVARRGARAGSDPTAEARVFLLQDLREGNRFHGRADCTRAAALYSREKWNSTLAA